MDDQVYCDADDWAFATDEVTELTNVIIELSGKQHAVCALLEALKAAAVREAEMWKELQVEGNFIDREQALAELWAERQKRNDV